MALPLLVGVQEDLGVQSELRSYLIVQFDTDSPYKYRQ